MSDETSATNATNATNGEWLGKGSGVIEKGEFISKVIAVSIIPKRIRDGGERVTTGLIRDERRGWKVSMPKGYEWCGRNEGGRG